MTVLVYTGVVDVPHIYVDCGRKGVPSDYLDVKGEKRHDYVNNCRMDIFIICAFMELRRNMNRAGRENLGDYV